MRYRNLQDKKVKPVEIEILLRDHLTSGLVKSDAEIKKFLASVRDAFSSTEGRSGKLYASLKKTEELINEYSAALSKAMEDRRKYHKNGDTEAYEKESEKIKMLADDLKVLRSVKSKVFQEWDENKKKLDEVGESTQNLSNSTKDLSDSTKEASVSGEKYSSTLVKMLGGQQAYNAILGALPPEARQVITGIEGMTKASLAFIATPLGMVLAALATTLALLNTYWHGTVEGEREFAEVSGYASGVLKSLKDECIDMGKKLSDMFKNPIKSVKEYWKEVYTDFKEGFSSIGGSAKAFGKILSSAMAGDIDGVKAAFDEMVTKLAEGSKKLWKHSLMRKTGPGTIIDIVAFKAPEWHEKAQRDAQISADQQKIEEERVDNLYREAKIGRELAKLRNEMYSGDANARIKAQAKAQELVNEQYGKQIELAERARDVAKRNYDNHKSNLEDKRAYEEARAEVERLKTAKEQAMLPFNRRAASAANTLAKQAAQDAKETAKAEGNLAFMDAKQQAQNERAARQLALQTQQAYIDGMDEGHEKVMAQLKLQREQELLAIDQQKDNALMAKIAQAKQQFDADKSNQGKVFDMSSVAFSEEELAQWDALIEAVETKLDKLERDAMQGEVDAMRQYLENYGTYQEQKLAIAEEYADKIKKAQSEGERLSLTKEREGKLGAVEERELKERLDWENVFDDVARYGTQTLKHLRGVLEKELGTVLGEDVAKLLKKKLVEVEGTLNARKDYIGQLFPMVGERKANGEKVSWTDYLGMADAGNPFEWVQLVSENAQGMADLVDTMGLGATEFGEGVHSFADGCASFSNVVGDLMNGNVFGAVSDTIKGLRSWGDVFGFGSGNEAKVAQAIERLTERNELLEQAIKDLTDEMKTARGAGAINASQRARKLQEETNENYKRIAQEQASYSSAHHSFNYYWGGYNQEQINRLSQQIGRQWNGDLWNLTPEEMKMLRTNVDMWQRIEDTGKGGYGGRVAEKLNDYIDQAGKLQEITDALYETLTTTTKDNVFDDFLNSLYDLADGSEDVMENIADNWQKMVNRMAVNNLVGAKFQKDLESWYENLAKLNEARTNGEITDEEYRKRLDALKAEYEGYVNDAKRDIETLRSEGIIKATKENSGVTQSGKAGAFTTMSQDQGTKLEGLFVSGQMHWSSMDDKMTDVSEQIGEAGETLKKIEANTSSSAKSAAGILEELKKMIRDGLKVK